MIVASGGGLKLQVHALDTVGNGYRYFVREATLDVPKYIYILYILYKLYHHYYITNK